MKRTGLALLVVLCVLGVLAILGVAFVTLSRLERRASQQRIHATRALLLARSGIEDALARLSAGQAPSRTDTRYSGEDFDANGVLNAGLETAEQRFNPSALDTDACPLSQALRPSFFVHDRTGAGALPALLSLDGRWRGFSGRLGQPLQGASYALKLEDESAKINVNGGFLDDQDRDNDGIPDHRDGDVRIDPADPKDTGLGWNAQLARILGVLVRQPELGLAPMPTAGMDILLNRPLGGYRSIAEVQLVLGTSNDLSVYLTVSSWVDRKVVHPNAWIGQSASLPLSQCEVMKGRQALALEQEGRPPVNLNAAPRAVLASLMEGLSGISWVYEREPAAWTIDATIAASVATSMIAQRPFPTWSRFSAFLDGLVGGTINGPNPYSYSGRNICRADLLKANFDPNTALNKTLPDQDAWRWLDKSDLTAWSTEGSLYPTGAFRISCTGRVLSPEGHLLAERSVEVVTEAFSLLRQTSQKDFLSGREMGQCITLSNGTVPTCGASASWNTWFPGQGYSLLTYPAPPTALSGGGEDRDGSIALATLDHPAPAEARFLQHLDDGWVAERGVFPDPVAHAENPDLQKDLTVSVWPDPFLPAPRNEPNTLRPDGAHLQDGHGIAFPAEGNFPPDLTAVTSDHAVVGYWTKALRATKDYRSMGFTCVRWEDSPLFPDRPDTQFWGIGSMGIFETWGVIGENLPWYDDVSYERQYRVYLDFRNTQIVRFGGPRWALVTGLWDTDETTIGNDVHLLASDAFSYRDAYRPDYAKGYPDLFHSKIGAPYPTGEALVAPGVPFVLGAARGDSHFALASEVMDEFALCDFGDSGSLALARAETWHADRLSDGRYYKENDGAFRSADLTGADGGRIRLLKAHWTVRLPSDPILEAHWRPVSYVQPVGNPRLLDPRLQASDVLVEILPPLLAPIPLEQGGRVDKAFPSFRYRVTFKPDPRDPGTGNPDANQPVLETPVFEDITFVCQPVSGPRVTSCRSD